MLLSTGHRKVQTNNMKVYRKQQQYNYHRYHCELCHVTAGNAVVIAVCILMLPMVRLTAEHMTFGHNPLVLSSLSNVLPMMVLQNSIVWLNISFRLNTSSHFSVRHTPFSLHLNLLSCLRRSVVVVLALLLMLSGDIETNPGPLGELSMLIIGQMEPCSSTVLGITMW